MKDEKLISLKQLQDLCNVNSPQVMLQWVKTNLNKLNVDDIHAQKVGKSWLFDSVAVERTMTLRGISQQGIATVATDNARVQELEKEKDLLQNNLVMAQSILSQKQEDIIKLQGELLNTNRLLAEAHTSEIKAEAKQEALQYKLDLTGEQVQDLLLKVQELETHNTGLLQKVQDLVTNNNNLVKLLQRTQQELQKERSKGLLDRLLNR